MAQVTAIYHLYFNLVTETASDTMSHAKKLRTTIGLLDSDCRLIKLHQHNLRAPLVQCRVNYYNWFRKHLGWTEKNGDPLLDGVCESYIGGSYDETFCSIQYNQAIHWHKKGMGAGHALAAQSALRHLFIDIAQKQGQKDLVKALCRVIDLTQSVQSMVFHLAHTLDRLRRVAEFDLARIQQPCSTDHGDISPSGLKKAYIDHYQWKLRAYALALGEPLDNEELPMTSDTCALGKWLNAGGLNQIPEGEQDAFLAAHERLHRLGVRILNEAKARRPFNIADYLIDMEAASEDIISVLSHRIDCQLRQLAAEDSLTHLGNRRLFERDLEKRVAHAKRSKEGLGLLFIDIDKFKNINDRYGHAVGDEVIQGTARRIVEVLRTADNIYRWGGEEFAALVTIDSRKELTTAAERLRESFTETDHFTTQGLVNITISIGGSYASPAKKSSPNTLFSSADRGLHQAKRAGRNRVAIAD